MSKMSPCKDCSDRHPYCHSQCEKYKEWRDEFHAEKLEKAKAIRTSHGASWSDAKRKAVWNSYRRDCSGAKKKFKG